MGQAYHNEQERKIFFELKPRCALLLSVVGAYNSEYEIPPTAPSKLPLVASSRRQLLIFAER
jgi:hypothetical protein